MESNASALEMESKPSDLAMESNASALAMESNASALAMESNALDIFKLIQQSKYTPIHFFYDNTSYFITAAIYNKRPLLADERIKTKLLRLIQKSFLEKDWKLEHWVIIK